jgi:hypothetical protein
MQGKKSTVVSVLKGIILMPPPGDVSDRHSSCPPTGCWEHVSKPDRNGYRRVRVAVDRHFCHRLVYEILCGPVPEDLQLDHLCRNPGCCNPGHLEPVPGRENLRRGRRAKGIDSSPGKRRRLTDGEVRSIRCRGDSGEPYRKIALDYPHVCSATVHFVIQRKTYWYIADEPEGSPA